jgi:alginate O-acetyltransferase complex protein AlgJ
MSSTEESTNAPPTPAQWGVRWFAVVAVALLCASVPLLHLVHHGVLGRSAPIVRTRSQTPMPAVSWAGLAAGTWQSAVERHLREASPVTWWLRGNWNEVRYRASAPQSRAVHVGEDEWFFIRSSLHPDRVAFTAAMARRRDYLEAVRDDVRAAGAELLVVVVPDKVRVYPEHAFAEGVLPSPKAEDYDLVLAEFAAAGIATVDPRPALAQAKATAAGDPTQELYFRRDTHWRPRGALAVAQAVAVEVEARFAARLSPRQAVEIGNVTRLRAVGDLVANLGILTAETDDPVVGPRTIPLSLLADRLGEMREYYHVVLRTPGGVIGIDGKDDLAEVVLVGTSLSLENGMAAMALALGRPVHAFRGLGAGGTAPMAEAQKALPSLPNVRLVVWEMFERGLFEPEWNSDRY